MRIIRFEEGAELCVEEIGFRCRAEGTFIFSTAWAAGPNSGSGSARASATSSSSTPPNVTDVRTSFVSWAQPGRLTLPIASIPAWGAAG